MREATMDDWPAIWPFLREIVTAGETYTYDLDLTEDQARDVWMMLDPPNHTAVAVDADGTVLGTANVHPNYGGNGAHIANASFMVAPAGRGQGVGRALGEYILAWARAAGFRAMVFNAVVETNTAAVALWQSLGFDILTTIPEAFHHPTRGYVGLHVMHQKL